MPRHHERRLLPFTADQLYELVSDIESYPEFLPWCTGLRVRRWDDGLTRAGAPCRIATTDMSVRFKVFRETFTTKACFDDATREIFIEYLNGPFRFLENTWKFEEVEQGTLIDFFIDFEFRSFALQTLIGTMFEHALERMIRAFEERAHEIYDPV